jgi:hypothetical protein
MNEMRKIGGASIESLQACVANFHEDPYRDDTGANGEGDQDDVPNPGEQAVCDVNATMNEDGGHTFQSKPQRTFGGGFDKVWA